MLCVVSSIGTASKIKEELQESKRREALQKKIAAKIKKDGLLAALEQFGRKSSSSSETIAAAVDEYRVGDKKGSKKKSLLSSINNVHDDKGNGILPVDGLDLNKSSDSAKVRSLFAQSSINSNGIGRGSGSDRDRELNPLSSVHRQVASLAGRHVRISLSPHEHDWDSTLDDSDLPVQLSYNPHSKHEGNEMIDEEYDQLDDESQVGAVSPLRDSDEPLVMDDDAYESHYSDGVGGHYDSTYSTGDDESYDHDSHGDGEESPLGFNYASLSPPTQLNIGHAESNTAAAAAVAVNRTQLSSTANVTDRLYISDDED